MVMPASIEKFTRQAETRLRKPKLISVHQEPVAEVEDELTRQLRKLTEMPGVQRRLTELGEVSFTPEFLRDAGLELDITQGAQLRVELKDEGYRFFEVSPTEAEEIPLPKIELPETMTTAGWTVTNEGLLKSSTGELFSVEDFEAKRQADLAEFEKTDLPNLPEDLQAKWGTPEFFPAYQEYAAPILERQVNLTKAFSAVFPEVAEIGMVDSWLESLNTDESFQESFVKVLQQKGRTTETENLLKALGADVFQISEIFSKPAMGDDFVPPEMIERIAKGEIEVPVSPEIESRKSLWNTFYGSLRKGIHQTSQAVNKLLSMLPIETTVISGAEIRELTPEEIERAKQTRQMFAQNYTKGKVEFDDWAKKHPELEPPVEISQFKERVGQLPFIEQLGQYITNPMAMAYTIAEGTPPTLAALGAFAGVTALTGSPILGGVASFATFAPMQIEGIAQDLISAGAPEDNAYQLALPVGMIISSLDVVGEIPILRALSPALKGFEKGLQKELVNRAMVALLKKGLVTFTTAEFTEVLTEVAQQVIQDYTVSFFDKNRDVFANVNQTAVQTLIQVSPFAIFGGAVSVTTMRNGKPAKLTDLYDEKVDAYRKANLPTQEAKLQALNDMAKLPEGEAAIKKAHDNLVKTGKTGLPEVPVTPTVAPEMAVTAPVPAKVAPTAQEVKLPTPEPGQPEAGIQPSMIEGVAAEVSDVEIERAANIRLDKYPEEVRGIIKEWAQSHIAEISKARRGVIPDEQIRAEAEKLASETGGDITKLRKKWKPGKAWNAEELLAIRSVLNQKTRDVLNAQKAVRANNSTHNLLKLELALREQASVQEIVSGVTAEAGRALRSFRQNVFDVLKTSDVERMEEMLKKIGKDRTDLEKIAELLGRLDPSDPIAVNNFIRELYKPHFFDYVTELFYNSILSGPKTHIVNSLSNTANALLSPIERLVSALVDLPLAKIQGREQARFLDEIPADIIGAWRGVPEGFRQFAYVIKNGISFDQATKWEFRPKAFKGKLGAVIGMPSRFLEAADALMKAVNQRAALNAEAVMIAIKEKLKGGEFQERIAELLSSPTEEMLREANKTAEYRLFRAPPGKFGQTLMTARDAVDIKGFKPLRFVIPFIRTPYNLVRYGLERTPLGYLNPELWKNVSQKNPEAADQIARATIGTIGLAALATYFAAGMITGAAPRDRAERDRFYREGKQPYAIRVGGFWVSYQRLEPFNQLLSMVAIVADMIRHDDKGIDEKIADAANTFGQNFISQTYMSSVSDLLNMLAEPERYAGNWINRFAASMAVPMSSATRTAAQMLDDTVRDPDNAWETIEASIPGLSNNVKAKLSSLGEDIKRKSPAWFPVSITPVEETILSQELERLEYDIGFTGVTISGIELTEQEQYDYQKLSGQIVKDDLEKLMLDPTYWQVTDTEKHALIDKVIGAARDWARSKMREKLWGEKAPEERITELSAALKSADNQLGKVISAAPDLSNGKPNIYDIVHELDSSYRKLTADIPVRDIPKNAPATVTGWYEKESALKELNIMPGKRLYEIHMTGDVSLENYVKQWQMYNEIADERERQEFIKNHPNYNLGNIPRRQLDLLYQYNSLEKEEQKQFLIDHPELKANYQTDWLKSHPKENALLAIWGEAKILTPGAYDEYKRLMVEYDIPDNALPEMVLPPETSVDTHFAYEDMVADKKYSSDEAKLLLLKDYISAQEKGSESYLEWAELQIPDEQVEYYQIKVDNAELYERLGEAQKKDDKNEIAKIRTTKVGDETFHDIERRVEAMGKGTREIPLPRDIVDAHVKYMQILDQEGIRAQEAEAMLFLLNPDNENYYKARLDADLWGQTIGEIDMRRVPIWQIDFKYRAQDTEYFDDIPAKYSKMTDEEISNLGVLQGYNLEWWGTLSVDKKREYWVTQDRADIMASNEEYRLDNRRRDAYALQIKHEGEVFPDNFVETYGVFKEIPETGERQERFLIQPENLKFAEFMRDVIGSDKAGKVLDNPKLVRDVEFDNLYDQFNEQFVLTEAYDNIESDNFKESYPKDKETGRTPREQANWDLRRNTNGTLNEFGVAEIRREGYEKYIPEKFINRYTDWGVLNTEGIPADWPKDDNGDNLTWYEDDWYLQEHPAFYQDIYLDQFGLQKRDFSKVPTRDVWRKYVDYLALDTGKDKDDFRWNNRDLDKWLVDAKNFTPIAEKRRKTALTPQERAEEEARKAEKKLVKPK